jgi:hypothetical protein
VPDTQSPSQMNKRIFKQEELFEADDGTVDNHANMEIFSLKEVFGL